MPTLIATIGAADANSYSTIAELATVADQLFPQPTAWIMAEEDDQVRIAIGATKLLDQLAFVGWPATETQSLAWPRRGVSRGDGFGDYTTTELPVALKQAHARLCFFLAAEACRPDPFAPNAQQGLTRIDFGSEISMSFDASATAQSTGAQYMREVIRPILRGLVYASQPTVVR